MGFSTQADYFFFAGKIYGTVNASGDLHKLMHITVTQYVFSDICDVCWQILIERTYKVYFLA